MASHINSSIPLATQLQWYKTRDTFFGQNYESEDVIEAIRLAESCDHPDARWLTEACAGKEVTSKERAREVFLALGPDDARALCFAWMCGGFFDVLDASMLQRSAELGFAFAQSEMAQFLDTEQTRGQQQFNFAQLAAAQGERDGFFWVGRCLFHGWGCQKDVEKAKKSFLQAFDLGDLFAVNPIGRCFETSDPQRWRWFGRAADGGRMFDLVDSFPKQVELFSSGAGNRAVMFAIGEVLHAHTDLEARTLFNRSEFASVFEHAQKAVSFYTAQCLACRKAVNWWTLIGVRLKVVKDIRKLIAKLIWDSRKDALFDV